MKLYKVLVALLAIVMMSAQVVMGQMDIITADQFKDMVKENPELVILDANKSKGYNAAHLKNAVHINHNDLYKDGDLIGLIKSPEELAEIFGALGVGGNRMVVLTDDGSQKYTSRVYWILKYLGYDNVVILPKVNEDWSKARLVQTATPGKANPTTFDVMLRPEVFASLDDVVMAQNDPMKMIVDARSTDEYLGQHKNSVGHIPGAIHLKYEDLLTDNGTFKTKAELEKIALDLGLTPDKELIFYCRTSVRAGVHFVAFSSILGYDNVKVYDGAYVEWASTRDVVQ